MVCEFCGAEYADNQPVCPYCGGEDEKAAGREQQAILEEYQKKTKQVLSLPEQIAKKASKGVSLLILGIIVLFVIAVGIVWAVTRAQAMWF